MIKLKVISPKDYETLKKDHFIVNYAFEKCPFGICLIGLHDTAICHLSFVDHSKSKNLDVLKQDWPGAALIPDENAAETARRVFHNENKHFKVLLKGTPFEAKVWQELLKIPKGITMSYQQVAVSIGHDKAVRAVASAVAKNSVSYLIPCHRVIKKNGNLHKYQWGSDIKKKILEHEKCQFQFVNKQLKLIP